MGAPEKLYTDILMSLIRGSSDIATFRKLADLGMPHATEAIASENERFAATLLENQGLDLGSIKTADLFRFLGGPAAVGGSLTAHQVLAFRRAVDGASIVFMHTTLDGAVTDLCRVTALLAPKDWHPYIAGRKVTIAALASMTTDQLQAQALEEYLAALDRESLIRRVDCLLAICRPGDLRQLRPTFAYERDELERLDRLRQAIVHTGGPPPDLKDAPKAVEYLLNVGLLLFEVVNHRYGVRIDPLHGIGIQLPPVQPPPAA
jgi:hypothetical protein